MAKAAGKPEPPKPQRPKMDKGKGKEVQHEEYRKKKPMGEAQVSLAGSSGLDMGDEQGKVDVARLSLFVAYVAAWMKFVPQVQRPELTLHRSSYTPVLCRQHKTDVARYTHFRQQQLVEQNNCMSREKQELECPSALYLASLRPSLPSLPPAAPVIPSSTNAELTTSPLSQLPWLLTAVQSTLTS